MVITILNATSTVCSVRMNFMVHSFHDSHALKSINQTSASFIFLAYIDRAKKGAKLEQLTSLSFYSKA